MAEKRFYWLKLKEDYFNNPKIKKLRKIAGGDTFTIIYLKMQLLSVSNKGIIEFEGIEPTIQEELALKLDEDLDNVEVTLNYLKMQGLVETNNNEFLLLDACKNIGSESESAERVRLFREREKQKSLQCNESVTEVLQSSISISNSISNNKENVHKINTDSIKVKVGKDLLQELEKQGTENLGVEFLEVENPTQYNNKQLNTKKENNYNININSLFEFWNSKNIIKHKQLNSDMIKAIDKALKNNTFDEIKIYIDRYNEVIKNNDYFFNTIWSLKDFLKQNNAMNDFKDDGSKWVSYCEWKKGKPKQSTQNYSNHDYSKTDLNGLFDNLEDIEL